MLTRRKFLRNGLLVSTAIAFSNPAFSLLKSKTNFISKRPALKDRLFVSEAVEQKISDIKKDIADPEMAWLFENCFPNTLDTTVKHHTANGKPDTFIITDRKSTRLNSSH